MRITEPADRQGVMLPSEELLQCGQEDRLLGSGGGKQRH